MILTTVSGIIPNYNHAPNLKKQINSVLNQTFQDFEMIIVDDKSPDKSKEVIERCRDHPKTRKKTTFCPSKYYSEEKDLDNTMEGRCFVKKNDNSLQRYMECWPSNIKKRNIMNWIPDILNFDLVKIVSFG